MKLDTFLAKHPVFTVEELGSFLAENGSGNAEARQTLLRHHLAHGRLVHVRRGLYATVPPGRDPATFPVDPILVASRLSCDAVLAYHTALQFHGIAQSVRSLYPVLSDQPLVRGLRFRGQAFRAVRPAAALRRAGAVDLGVETRDRAGLDVRVTSLERTLVDVLDRPDLGGGWEEIWRSLGDAGYLDVDLVVDCALAMDSATLTAKVGYFLEQHQQALLVDPARLARLRAHRPRQPRYLDRTAETAQYIPEWNLIVPESVAAQTWQEGLT